MRVLLDNESIRLTLDDPAGIVRCTRSGLSFPSVHALEAGLREMIPAMAVIERRRTAC